MRKGKRYRLDAVAQRFGDADRNARPIDHRAPLADPLHDHPDQLPLRVRAGGQLVLLSCGESSLRQTQSSRSATRTSEQIPKETTAPWCRIRQLSRSRRAATQIGRQPPTSRGQRSRTEDHILGVLPRAKSVIEPTGIIRRELGSHVSESFRVGGEPDLPHATGCSDFVARLV
jgi:hypothetical protein